MDMISLQGKTNFFEKRVSDYAKANVIVSRGDPVEASLKVLYVPPYSFDNLLLTNIVSAL